jgi:hypothetical protein
MLGAEVVADQVVKSYRTTIGDPKVESDLAVPAKLEA